MHIVCFFRFTPKRDTAVTVDWQRIRLQEHLADDAESGRVPRTVECELTEDLVDSCVPGDVVTVTGIVKVISVDAAAGTLLTFSHMAVN
jgi:DNA helicase MCM8